MSLKMRKLVHYLIKALIQILKFKKKIVHGDEVDEPAPPPYLKKSTEKNTTLCKLFLIIAIIKHRKKKVFNLKSKTALCPMLLSNSQF